MTVTTAAPTERNMADGASLYEAEGIIAVLRASGKTPDGVVSVLAFALAVMMDNTTPADEQAEGAAQFGAILQQLVEAVRRERERTAAGNSVN